MSHVAALSGKREKRPVVKSTATTRADSGGLSSYVRAAVDRECSDLRATAEGSRNHRLNAAAYSLGQLVGGGALPESTAVAELGAAAKACGLGDTEAEKTIASGIGAGKQEPRSVPEPERRESSNGDAGGASADDFGPTDYDELPDDDVSDPTPPNEPAEQGPALRRLADVLPAAIELAEHRRSGDVVPVPVPWRAYGESLAGGLWPGMHVRVGGTGFGKTQFEMQGGLYAAARGVPVAYVGLELDEPQVALRLLGEDAGVRWSNLYTGRCTERDLERARAAVPKLSELPIYVETGPPNGWAASHLTHLAETMRRAHPKGPMLMIVDFLQLIGDDPSLDRRADLRERIGRAAYQARHVARTYDAAVVLVSSAARDKYGILAGKITDAGLGTSPLPGHVEPTRTISNPDALVGLGKESGEIEFAADSVTVLARWPVPLETGERCYIVAVPKLRYGPPTWMAMRFAWRFEELPFKTLGDLPELPKRDRGAGRPTVDPDDYAARVLLAIQKHGPVASQRKLEQLVSGTATHIRAALQSLIESGRVKKTDVGFTASETGSEATQ